MRARLTTLLAVSTIAALGAAPALAGSTTGFLPGGTPVDVSADQPPDGSEHLVPPGWSTIDLDVSGRLRRTPGLPTPPTCT